MKRLVTALIVALSVPMSTLHPTVAVAAEAVPFDQVLASLQAEAAALSGLVDVVKVEVRGSRLDLSVPAKFSWQDAQRGFEDIVAHGSVGDWKSALIATRPTRSLARVAADETFSIAKSKAIHDAVKRYVDAIEPRVEATRRLVRDMPADEEGRDLALETAWWKARAEFEEAKKLAAVDNPKRAWRTLETAVGRLDAIVLEIVYGYVEPDRG